MINVFIIGKTQVDFQTLFSVLSQALGRSVSKPLDEAKTPAKAPTGFIAALMEFKSPNSKLVAAIRRPGFTLLHVHYTLLVVSTPEVVSEVQQQTNLHVITERTRSGFSVSVMTGSLDQWRSAIINGLSESCEYGLRLFLDTCLLEFDKEGLGPMFQDYNRVPHLDQTFSLKKIK